MISLFTFFCLRWHINYCPCINPCLRRFIFPYLKFLMIDNCWLNYYFLGRHPMLLRSLHFHLHFGVFFLRSLLLDSWCFWISLRYRKYFLGYLDRQIIQKMLFDILFVAWAPFVFLIVGFCCIDFWLRFNCYKFFLFIFINILTVESEISGDMAPTVNGFFIFSLKKSWIF